MVRILAAGYSRIPVYEGTPHNIRGILLVKQLIVVNTTDQRVIRSLGLRSPCLLPIDINLLDVLNEFQRTHTHFAIICNQPDTIVESYREGKAIPPDVHMAGIVTIEDVIERLIKEEIEDETDHRSNFNIMVDQASHVKSLKEQGKKYRMRALRDLASLQAKKGISGSGLLTTTTTVTGDALNSNPVGLGSDILPKRTGSKEVLSPSDGKKSLAAGLAAKWAESAREKIRERADSDDSKRDSHRTTVVPFTLQDADHPIRKDTNEKTPLLLTRPKSRNGNV